MNNKHLFLDLHVIQTLPPCNINRDDTGSPKTAQYGGVRRARVSSQAWKKAMRDYFNSNGEQTNVGVRTLEIVAYVADKILELDADITKEEARKLAEKVLNDANIKTTKEQKTKALFFLGDSQAQKLAEAAINNNVNKEELHNILTNNPAIDIALFGRMVADDPSLNEDASSQVAHAISTHAIANEFDFFTAVDDLSTEENSGAGMLGNIEFNSSTLYRYANVAVHEFTKQLGGDKDATIKALKLFVEAFVKSLPTGKVNTFANQTIPQALIVTLRQDRPINMVSAFENPIKSNEGYVNKSVYALAREFKKTEKFLAKPVATMYLSMDEVAKLAEIGDEKASLQDLLGDLAKTISELID